MYVLGIDSSTRVAGVALLKGEQLVAEEFLNTGLTHSETLLPTIERVLDKAGIKGKDLEALGVTSGPGSFTGLRIGVSTARALAQVLDIPVVGVPTLDVLAGNLPGHQNLICPILDARKREVYTAFYKYRNLQREKLSGYQALSIPELVDQVRAFGEPITFLGDGWAQYGQELLNSLGSMVQVAPISHRLPKASITAVLAQESLGSSSDREHSWQNLTPFYLRASEAEVSWAAKEAQRQG